MPSKQNTERDRTMKISDERILRGFCTFDERITKEYFYGYVRKAYDIFDYRYQLHGKPGLDFYSLAHEYYIYLLKHDFKPLTDRPNDVKLSSHMVNGFRYVVLDALKAYNKEFKDRASSSADLVLSYVRSTDKEEGMLFQVADAVASHYHDRKMQEIAHMIFFMGYKQKEVAAQLGMTPSALNQRYRKMMDEVVTPFIIENYGSGIYLGARTASSCGEAPEMSMPCSDSIMANIIVSESRMADECDMCNETTPTGMNNDRITPEFVTSLKPNEVFVFGSNLQGMHAGGAARIAHQKFGAIYGQGVGMQGQSYAIPTIQGLRVGEHSSGIGGVETIKPYVDEFIVYAKAHPEQQFLVTPIGCGIAGFESEDIAPLFEEATDVENISLPEMFWDCL